MDKSKIIKTTLEMPEKLAYEVSIYVIQRKLKGKFSLKQFINEAVQEKLDRERCNV